MLHRPFRIFPALVAFVLAGTTIAGAQILRPKADVTALVETGSVKPGTTVRAALKIALPEGLHVQSNAPRDPSLIPTTLSADTPAGVTLAEIVYPAATDLKQAGSDQALAVFERDFAIGLSFSVASSVAGGDLAIPVRLRYQACDAQMCYPPARADATVTLHVGAGAEVTRDPVFDTIAFGHGTAPAGTSAAATAAPAGGSGSSNEAALERLDGFELMGSAGGYLGSTDFLKFLKNAEAGVKEQGWFEGRGPLAILLIVFLGGLALNLTPCVLPMIPINLAIIGAGSQVGYGPGFPTRQRGFLLGAVYGSAMAVVYGVLGVVVILTAGTFGTLNASPWFNLGITLLFIVLGLAMFDVIMIDFSSLSSGFAPKARAGSYVLAFTMGAVAALLAGACVAPVVIQVVLFSSNLYAAGTKVALALPFVLGIGMAIPWPIAGAGIAAMPKPGAWMVRVKQAFGVIILATAAYYGYETYSIFANRFVDPKAVASAIEARVKSGGWHASLAEGLDTAARERKPVLIDMWATWCKNCLTMDKTTLEDPAVEAALKDYVKIKFQAEEPDSGPTKAVMQRFDAVGLPTYVVLKPKSTAPARASE